MDHLQELIDWATSHGVKMNGISPKRIPGRGIGVVATRAIQVDEIILDVPTNCLRTLSTVPKTRLRKLSSDTGISVHGILAADLVLDRSDKYGPWDAIVPREEDFAGMPLTWSEEAQVLLPQGARELLDAQKAKFARDWKCVGAAFPELLGDGGAHRDRDRNRDRYRHAWLLVNSRTFYYLDAALKRRRGVTKDDHMAMQPVADLFNHSDEGGCHTAYGSDGYAFRATVSYEPGDEVKICYGHHGGDSLLVEYGFVMAENCWDEVSLDEFVLSRLDAAQKSRLEEAGFLGRYVMDRETVCHRTQVALRLLCCTVGEWMRFVNGHDDGEASQGAVDSLLTSMLWEYAAKVADMLERVRQLEASEEIPRATLIERWLQIRSLLDTRMESLHKEFKHE